jgi:hypothetical protein
MERRLNCYNYIFSNCSNGSKCPFGHVIVPDKDEYLRQMESNENDLNFRTSPRGGFSGDLNKINDIWNDYEHKKNSFEQTSEMCFIACSRCRNLKSEIKSVHKYLKQHGIPYICYECKTDMQGEDKRGGLITSNFNEINRIADW